MNTADLIWLNGEFVAWEDAKVHVLTHSTALRDGRLRGRPRVRDGRRRARRSSATTTTSTGSRSRPRSTTWTCRTRRSRSREATHELIVRNGFKSCYIRPLVYRGYGPMGLDPLNNPVEAMVACWEWGAYLGEEGKRNGIRAHVSSWRRISPDSLIPHAKASGQYLNSVLAKIGATKAGYEEAILLDDKGYVCEGTGENIFVVKRRRDPHARPGERDPRRHQPQVGHRDRRATWATRSSSATSRAPSCTCADELFLSGTAAELTPVREIDDHAARPARRGHPRGPVGLRGRPVRPRRALRQVARPRAGSLEGVSAVRTVRLSTADLQ